MPGQTISYFVCFEIILLSFDWFVNVKFDVSTLFQRGLHNYSYFFIICFFARIFGRLILMANYEIALSCKTDCAIFLFEATNQYPSCYNSLTVRSAVV